MTIQGARTGLAAGAVPFGGHIMNLSHQTRILGMRLVSDGCFSLIAQPGVALSVLNRFIADKKFNTTGWDEESLRAYEIFKNASPCFFPPDPTETSATVGGIASCNASGAKSFRYGATRNYVRGMRVVLSDGDVLSLRRGDFISRGRSLLLRTDSGRAIKLKLPTYIIPKTKCASGYYIEDDMDAVDLFIGMDGTLGVITELELLLIPSPAVVWGAMLFFKDERSALDFVATVRDGGDLKIAALEYFDSNVLDILRREKIENPAFSKLPLPPERHNCAIYAELHCSEEKEAFERLFLLGEYAEKADGCEEETWVSRTTLEYNSLIGFRHAAPECVNMIIDHRKKEHPNITKLGTDLSVPDRYLTDIMSMYHTMLRERDIEYAIWGHIGNNHVHVNVLPRNEMEYNMCKALYTEWAERVVGMGGAVSAEHGIGKLKAEQLAVMYTSEHFSEMRALKFSLDPKGIFGRDTLFPHRGER